MPAMNASKIWLQAPNIYTHGTRFVVHAMNTYYKANLMFIYHIVRADHRSPSILEAIPTTIHHVNLDVTSLR